MRLCILLCSTLLCFFSCQRVDDDNVEFESEGEITGIDFTLCACCGGFQTKFEGREEIFLFSELPSDSNLDLTNPTFPIKIRANWTEGVSIPCPRIITIEDIELAE